MKLDLIVKTKRYEKKCNQLQYYYNIKSINKLMNLLKRSD